VDYFPPVVDDAFAYGQIAAANSLSDVYAMGGRPLTALSIVCFPSGLLELEALGEILRGAAEKCREADTLIVGGQSVRDPELKFGLSVTGLVHPKKIAANAGARPGDLLFLTKPLGIGPVTVAQRQGNAGPELLRRATVLMAGLNRAAAEAMGAVGINARRGVHAATDVTGFGLAGHAVHLARAGEVTLAFETRKLPILDGALPLAEAGLSTGARAQNEAGLKDEIEFASSVPEALRRIVLDAETSGGLLIAVAAAGAARLEQELAKRGAACRAPVGRVEKRGPKALRFA
jgi:selenide,water dikinase